MLQNVLLVDAYRKRFVQVVAIIWSSGVVAEIVRGVCVISSVRPTQASVRSIRFKMCNVDKLDTRTRVGLNCDI